MKNLHLMVIASAALLFLQCTTVETGRAVTCRICKKQILSAVRSRNVPSWDVRKYTVVRAESLCTTCGDELVPWIVGLRCEKCGKTHDFEEKEFPRKLGKESEYKASGYCPGCAVKAGVEGAVGEGGRMLGKFIGGLKKGLRE
jgi:hypothetical protein